ncbi:unnamed protein product [Ixodes persulcatus]
MFRSGNFLLNITVLVALLQLVNALIEGGSGEGGLIASIKNAITMIMEYVKKMFSGEGFGAFMKKAAEA